MNSTGSKSRSSGPIRGLYAVLGLAVLAVLSFAPSRTAAADDPMPRPPQLERDVQFWIRVYSEIDTNSGFLHDEYNLGVVYETLHFAPGSGATERERVVETARGRVTAALRRIAQSGEGTLNPDDQKIRDMWGTEGTPARLKSAADDIRFQLGQADRFRAGLIRS